MFQQCNGVGPKMATNFEPVTGKPFNPELKPSIVHGNNDV
uniref:Uncharacterized protein n=1 Tax=Tetranychus urticae TaxID=32264 RepID=T1K9G8_TETUR